MAEKFLRLVWRLAQLIAGVAIGVTGAVIDGLLMLVEPRKAMRSR